MRNLRGVGGAELVQAIVRFRGNRAQARSSQSELGTNSMQLRLNPVSGVTGGLPLIHSPATADFCSDRPCGRYAVFDSACDRRLQAGGHGVLREWSFSR